jgi:hypothetical protein
MMTHTPGPWQARKAFVYSSKPHVQLAHCGANFTAGVDGTRSISDGEAEANARLIAAAPDLLAALRCVVAAMDDNDMHSLRRPDACDVEADALRVLIAAAGGQS